MNNSENNNLVPNGVVPNNTNVPPTPAPQPVQQPVQQPAPVAPPVAPSVTPNSMGTPNSFSASQGDTEVLEVAPPTVAPPTVASVVSTNPNSSDEDNRILKPIVETLEEEVLEEKKEEVVTPQVSVSESMSNNIIAAKEKVAMENRNLKEVKVEYKEPGFFRKFLMFFIIGALFVAVFFLPDITAFLEEHKQEPDSEPIVEEKISTGTLTCEKSSNDKAYDYIHSFDFTFDNSLLKTMNYSITTKGSVATDLDDLTARYNNCKKLSGEFANLSIGTNVSCDLIGATYVTSYSVDYDSYSDEIASPIFQKYKTIIPEYESDQNIDDIERNLTTDGYSCDRVSK